MPKIVTHKTLQTNPGCTIIINGEAKWRRMQPAVGQTATCLGTIRAVQRGTRHRAHHCVQFQQGRQNALIPELHTKTNQRVSTMSQRAGNHENEACHLSLKGNRSQVLTFRGILFTDRLCLIDRGRQHCFNSGHIHKN